MEDYEPYGDEWEKEMMKMPKKALIDMVKRIKTESRCEHFAPPNFCTHLNDVVQE